VILETLRGREVFTRLAQLDEDVFPLDRAAFAIALEEYPDLDVDEYLRRLDTLAARAEVVRGTSHAPQDSLDALRSVLFVQEGLRGNNENYYDPRNSFLNEVLDRRIGIPISLSVIFIEVARRMDVHIEGVGFPGHFMVKYPSLHQGTLIDPFNLGRVLSQEDCQELLDRVYSGTIQVQPAFFSPMGKKAILSRMLYNLKGIYYQQEQFQKALAVVERILLVNPGTPSEIRDRGLLYMQTSLFSKALADLEYYMAHTSAPEDASYVEGHIKTLRNIVSCSN
jgi:regulator of sirC expression with transglutaminase-like and TPR domain